MSRRLNEFALNVSTITAASCAMILTGLAIRDRVMAPRQGVVQAGTVSTAVHNWTELVSRGRRFGPDSAVVTIVEFGDYECPACGNFEKTLSAFSIAHRDQVAVVFRHWPLAQHRLAYTAARAAECAAAQGRFGPYHALLYERQDSLGLLSFEELATRAGVADRQEFQKCMRVSSRVPRIDADIRDAEELGGRGTPTVIINGRMLAGVPSLQELERALTEATERSARH